MTNDTTKGPVDETLAAILYGELWQQTMYGTMQVDSARENIIRFFMSDWFRTRAIDQQIAELTRERDAAREEAARLRGALTRAAIDAHAPHIPYKAIYRSVGTTLEECPLSICKRNYAALREQPTDTAEGD